MWIRRSLRTSTALRRPLLAVFSALLSPLRGGIGLFRRAAYDAFPLPYMVVGPREHYVVSTRDRVIGRDLFLHGEFDFWKLTKALGLMEACGFPRPKHLIDVGANIGTVTIPALTRGLLETAAAIEPHPGNLRLLRANIALNDLLERVTVYPFAAGDISETLALGESETNSGNHTISTSGIDIESIRLDDMVHEPHSLLWMDIEGYEGHALLGASALLATNIGVVCEYNPAFLMRSGGLLHFHAALGTHRIFDLAAEGGAETTLEELHTKYGAEGAFTDILALPDSVCR